MKHFSDKNFLYLKENKPLFFILFLTLFSGIIFGTFMFSNSVKTELKEYVDGVLSVLTLNAIDKEKIFINSFFLNFRIIFFIWIAGLCVFLIPVCFFQIFLKGFKMGYVIAFFSNLYGISGIFYSFLSYFSTFVIIPFIMFFSIERINLATKNYNKKNKIKIFSKKSLISFIFMIITIIILSLFDSFVMPNILKSFIGFFM